MTTDAEAASPMVAALYVATNGCYFGLPDVDPWDSARDARLYAGPYPVVAHPPCERWGRYWFGGPTSVKFPRERKVKGDDGGCFVAALVACRQWGGVIEHPAQSYAWAHHGLNAPPRGGGWVHADWIGGWTCHIEQGSYGHRARKATWLYAFGCELPAMKWGRAPGDDYWKIDDGFRSAEERARFRGTERKRSNGVLERLGHRERAATPLEFRDVLLSIARSAYVPAN